jgi:hypothetical protein
MESFWIKILTCPNPRDDTFFSKDEEDLVQRSDTI